MNQERWYLSKDKLENSPSRERGISQEQENLIREESIECIVQLGLRLRVKTIIKLTAMVYVWRFYMVHPVTVLSKDDLAAACLYLACKVEERPKELRQFCKNNAEIKIILENENFLISTLGFDLTVTHPHTYITANLWNGEHRQYNDLCKITHYLATYSYRRTTLPLQYKPTMAACILIHISAKARRHLLSLSKEGLYILYNLIDSNITAEEVENLSLEFTEKLEHYYFFYLRNI